QNITQITIAKTDGSELVCYTNDGGKFTFSNDSIVIAPIYEMSEKLTISLNEIQKINISNFTSIDEQALANINIYPNPAADFLQISNPENINMQLAIYSLNGELMLTDEFIGNKQINIATFSNGTYLLLVNGKLFKFNKI
ncbi:MAG: T9SS type A sorting domain-containing protein, partial [Ignavibacteria bacterium]|nr:T9SS type A sorting domain-containing protein [Ignavibacteria bacterium]